MAVKKKRLTLDMDPAFQHRLKATAALKGVSMRRYCLAAIDRELMKDEANGVSGGNSGPMDIEWLIARRKEILGDRVFSGSSVDLIREVLQSR